MGVLVAKTLANGKLGTTTSTLYYVPNGAVSAHAFVNYANNSTSNTYANLYVKRANPDQGTTLPTMVIGAGTLIIGNSGSGGGSMEAPNTDAGFKLATGDSLQGDASSANLIDFLVHGLEG